MELPRLKNGKLDVENYYNLVLLMKDPQPTDVLPENLPEADQIEIYKYAIKQRETEERFSSFLSPDSPRYKENLENHNAIKEIIREYEERPHK